MAGEIESLQLKAADQIARRYIDDGNAATFKVIVNPLVMWMWIGGVIGLIGALIAVWPSRSRRKGAMVRTEADELKEAKYREIRDAELDHASGKLSDEDYAILDAELRKEAVEILDTVGVGAGAGTPRVRVGRAGLPSDYVGGERQRQRPHEQRQRPSRSGRPMATATATPTAQDERPWQRQRQWERTLERQRQRRRSPRRAGRPRLAVRTSTLSPVYTILGVLQVIIAVVLVFLVLLHSGKDAGLSGAFGIGGGGSSIGGGSMVERNLDRATVFFAVLFVVNTVVILKVQ